MRDIFAQKMANDTVSENNPKKSYLNFRAKILVHYSQFTHFHFGAKIQNMLFLFLAQKFKKFCFYFWRENSDHFVYIFGGKIQIRQFWNVFPFVIIS